MHDIYSLNTFGCTFDTKRYLSVSVHENRANRDIIGPIFLTSHKKLPIKAHRSISPRRFQMSDNIQSILKTNV